MQIDTKDRAIQRDSGFDTDSCRDFSRIFKVSKYRIFKMRAGVDIDLSIQSGPLFPPKACCVTLSGYRYNVQLGCGDDHHDFSISAVEDPTGEHRRLLRMTNKNQPKLTTLLLASGLFWLVSTSIDNIRIDATSSRRKTTATNITGQKA